MPMIQVPHEFDRFCLSRERWQRENQWVAIALRYHPTTEVGTWFKGRGANPDLAAKDLYLNLEKGYDLRQYDKDENSRRVKEGIQSKPSIPHKPLEELF